MALSWRVISPCSMLPGKGPQWQTSISPSCTVAGKTFDNTVAGVILDASDYNIAAQLRGYGWTYLGMCGTTADRPVQALNGHPATNYKLDFFDTTIQKHIFWDGLVWRDFFTGAQV